MAEQVLEDLKKHGITKQALQNLIFRSGVGYKNLKWDAEGKKWQGYPLGATSGGSGFTYEPSYTDLALDGATVLVKGLKKKTGEKGTIKLTLAEFTEGRIVEAMHLTKDSTDAKTGFVKYVTKADIDDSDYIDNVAFVGYLTSGLKVIVIMENAICTGAMEVAPKDNELATFELTYECTADITQSDLDYLPISIYYEQTQSI